MDVDGKVPETETAPNVNTSDKTQFLKMHQKQKGAAFEAKKANGFTLVNFMVEVEPGEKPIVTIKEGPRLVLDATSSATGEKVRLGTLKKALLKREPHS